MFAGSTVPEATTCDAMQQPAMALSGWPSQSLSAEEVQSRAAGPIEPKQVDHTPLLQVWLPALQMPLPSRPACAPHGCTAPFEAHWHVASMALSGDPSQSLSSADAQSRGAGPTEPRHCDNTPFVHVRVPALQIPLPS